MATPFERLEGKYEILEKIREGGMGSVYKVRHRLLEEVRVVKVMRPHLADDEILKARFLREAKVAIKLRHPNLAQIYDFTMDDNGYAYLVMEFIDGFHLQDMVKVLGKPPLALVLEVSRQSLDALGYLHRKRIIHRDVSPDNILVTRDDEGALQVKLIDLGIAKVHHDGDDSLTSAGTFLGKVRYSSPEHFKTHEGAEVSAVSDLYSYGIVLYEMLTGNYPIQGESVASLISGHLIHPPQEFEISDPDGLVPEAIRAVVMKSLEKDPGARFESARKMRDALEELHKDHPLEEETLTALFEIPNLTTRKIQTIKKPGSSQSRMDRSFGVSTTPAPGEISDVDGEFEDSGTIETGGKADEVADTISKVSKPQIRALLLGASKLIEGKHFDEARLQLASVLDLDDGNAEALDLTKAVEVADSKTRQRRQNAADNARSAIEKEDFDTAAAEIEKAVSAYGEAEVLSLVLHELETAKQAVEERRQRVIEISDEAEAFSNDEAFRDAVDILEEGLRLDPGNSRLRGQLDIAERRLASQIEQERRVLEIEKSAETVMQHIDAGEDDQAARALIVARKLFGNESIFSDLETRLDELRHKQRLDRAASLRKQARSEIEAEHYEAAIIALDEAFELAPEVTETENLLVAAREGLRLQEEAAKRRQAIDAMIRKIDRLTAVGRPGSALRILDDGSKQFGQFDEEMSIRKKIDDQMAAREKAENTIHTSIDEALNCAASDAFSDANEKLEEAKAIAKDHPELLAWTREAETEIQRRLDAHRRQMALDNVVDSVHEQLEGGDLDEARRELAVAKRLYGTSDVLDELKSKIESRERELRQEEVEDLIKNALKKNRQFDDVISDLETALSVDPNNDRVQRLIVETRIAHRRSIDDDSAKENRRTLEEIDDLIADGENEKALDRLEAMISETGEFETARWLRTRLKESLASTT